MRRYGNDLEVLTMSASANDLELSICGSRSEETIFYIEVAKALFLCL